MNVMRIAIILAGLVFCVATQGSFAQTTTTIKGVVFSDYFYSMKNNDSAVKGQNGFQFRRVYFTVENAITSNIKMRFRLDAKHDKFGSTEKMRPFLKHAYLAWSNLIPNHTLYLGLAETNAFKNAEGYWGYRSIAKTILDLNKIVSSADMGLALKGDLGKFVHHWLTIQNGTGYGSSEVDKYKRIGYAFWLTPLKGLIVEGYADYEKQDPATGTFSAARDYFHSTGYSTLKAFVGYSSPCFTVGTELFARTNRESGATDASGLTRTDVRKQGISVFAMWITPSPKLKVFGRYDYFDPNADDAVFTGAAQNGACDERTDIIAGFDYIPTAKVHIMPNIWITSYTQNGLKNDVTARVTLYYNFNSGKITI